MGFELQELDPSSQASKPTGLSPELVAFINKACQDAAASAANTSAKLAAEMMSDAVERVERKLALIEAPTPKIMAVTVNAGTLSHLKAAAVPFLGQMIVNAQLGLNTMLVGPAGCGKTFGAHQLASALKRPFGHVCFTAGASETWLFGRQTPTGFIEGVFSRLYRMGGVFLADEFDAADANMLLALNTALANGTLFNPINGETYERHADFVFIAGCNTFGKGGDHVYTGRNRLDAATLDRFELIKVDYNADVEKQLCPDKTLYKVLTNARRELRKLKSDEVISTRRIQACYLRLQAGESGQDIIDSLTLSWPMELPAQVGLDVYPGKETLTDAPESTSDETVGAYPPPIAKGKLAETSMSNARIEELKRKLAGGQ